MCIQLRTILMYIGIITTNSSQVFVQKWERSRRLNDVVQLILGIVMSMSFQVCINWWNDNNDVIVVPTLLRFSRLLLIQIGLKGGVKYSSLLKLSGDFIVWICFIKFIILNLNWSLTVRTLDYFHSGLIW